MKLTRDFYNRNGLIVAEELLGKIFVHKTPEGIIKGRIVETEAYMGLVDKAAHIYRNPQSERTKIWYGEGGFLYVYMIYGMYLCTNIVANIQNIPEAVLIRALEPIEGIPLMRERRNTDKIKALCSGPGKLSQAMGITKESNGVDLCGNTVYLEDAPLLPPKQIGRTKRINIDYAEEARDFLYRFVDKNSHYLSKKYSMEENEIEELFDSEQ